MAQWQELFQPDERLLWQGAPEPGVHNKMKVIALAVMGLPFLMAGLGMLTWGFERILHAKRAGDAALGVFFMAFSAAFVGIGGRMVRGRWYGSAQAHRRVRDALTGRAYVAKAYFKRSSAVGIEEGSSVDTVWHLSYADTGVDGDRTVTRVGFENIAGGAEVFRLFGQIQAGATP